MYYISLDSDKPTSNTYKFKSIGSFPYIKGLLFTRFSVSVFITGGNDYGDLVNIKKIDLIGDSDGVEITVSNNVLSITTGSWNSVEGFLIAHCGSIEQI